MCSESSNPVVRVVTQYKLCFIFRTLYVQGEKCTKNTSTLPGLARSPPSAVPGLQPGRVHNKTSIHFVCLWHIDILVLILKFNSV